MNDQPAMVTLLPEAHRPYSLAEPPLRASTHAHANTIRSLAFSVAEKSLVDWPLNMTLIANRRQPLTSEVWACVLALMPQDDRPRLLDVMAEPLRVEVRRNLPNAIEWADNRGPGRGAHRRKQA